MLKMKKKVNSNKNLVKCVLKEKTKNKERTKLMKNCQRMKAEKNQISILRKKMVKVVKMKWASSWVNLTLMVVELTQSVDPQIEVGEKASMK